MPKAVAIGKVVISGIGILFIVAFAIIYLTVLAYVAADILHVAFPNWLANIPDKGKYFHDSIELIFFVVNIVVLPTAVLTLWVAKRQFEAAEKARLAAIYMEIAAGWNAFRIVSSRMYMLGLRDKFRSGTHTDKIKSESRSEQEYIAKSLEHDRTEDRIRHSRNTAILTYLEDLGVLCRKGYVREDDVFDLMASPIVIQMDLLTAYINPFNRKHPTNYEHALLLYQHAKDYLEKRAKSHRRSMMP